MLLNKLQINLTLKKKIRSVCLVNVENWTILLSPQSFYTRQQFSNQNYIQFSAKNIDVLYTINIEVTKTTKLNCAASNTYTKLTSKFLICLIPLDKLDELGIPKKKKYVSTYSIIYIFFPSGTNNYKSTHFAFYL